MKIAILLSRIDQTGMSTNTIDLCVALADLGHHVDLIVGDYYGSSNQLEFQHQLLAQSNVNVVNVNFSSRNKLWSKLLKLTAIAKILLRLLFKKYDAIHAESPYLSFVPWMVGKKFVSTMHVPDLENIFAYKNATRVIAISKETKDYCVSKFHYKEEEIDLVYHGVNDRFSTPISPDEKSKLKLKLDIEPHEIVIGLVASIEKRKGHDILISAIESLEVEIRKKIKLVLIGSYKSGSNNWIESLINNSPVKEQIRWLQYQDPKPFYDIMDIFVLPSRLEGFGLVVAEAMLAGCIVLRSDTEGATEQIINGTNGFIFKNEDALGLSQLLTDLIRDKNLMQYIKKNSKEDALKRFTQRVMAENTLKVYKKLQKSF